MHDLNTIRTLNAQAFEASIARHRASGKYVVTAYAGLHLRNVEPFDTLDAAEARAADIKAECVSNTVNVLPPLPSFHATERDQSEDRKASPVALRQTPTGLAEEAA